MTPQVKTYGLYELGGLAKKQTMVLLPIFQPAALSSLGLHFIDPMQTASNRSLTGQAMFLSLVALTS